MITRNTLIKTFNEYRDEHIAQLQAMVDADVNQATVEKMEQPTPHLYSFKAQEAVELNHNGTDYTWYKWEHKANLEVMAYNVVMTIHVSGGLVRAHVPLANGDFRKVILGEYGAGESFVWMPNKLAKTLRGCDEPIIYFDDELDFWHVLMNDSHFVNHFTYYMFNGCEYQD